MNNDVPMSILIVEDDLNECKKYKEIINNRKDVKLINYTNSSTKAIEICKKYKPEAVILDLELNDGEGNGFEFIENIRKLSSSINTKIIVTTNVHSNSVYNFCHENNVDFVFYKKQQNYSQENVINTLLLLKGYNSSNIINLSNTKEDTTDSTDKIIKEKINEELDNIGISHHLQGRQYLFEAIYFMIENGEKNQTPIVQHLVSIYKKSSSTISRAMQNAIFHAWRVMPIEDLSNYYTARINYERGVPTPTEFIYYYTDKIKKEI